VQVGAQMIYQQLMASGCVGNGITNGFNAMATPQLMASGCVGTCGITNGFNAMATPQLMASGCVGNGNTNGFNSVATLAQQAPVHSSPVPLSASSQLAGDRILYQVQQLGQHSTNQIPSHGLVAPINCQGQTADALVASHDPANSSIAASSSSCLAGTLGPVQSISEVGGILTGAGRVSYLARPSSDVDSVEFDSEDSSTWHVRDRCIVDGGGPPNAQQQQHPNAPSRSSVHQNSKKTGLESSSHPLECANSDGRQKNKKKKKSPTHPDKVGREARRSKDREKKKSVGTEHRLKRRSDHKHNKSFDQERTACRDSSGRKTYRQVRSVSVEMNEAKNNQNGATAPSETVPKEISRHHENVSVVQQDTEDRGPISGSEKQASPVKSCLSTCHNPTETGSALPNPVVQNTQVPSQVTNPDLLCRHGNTTFTSPPPELLTPSASPVPQTNARSRTDECTEAASVINSGSGCHHTFMAPTYGSTTTSQHAAQTAGGESELASIVEDTATPPPTESMPGNDLSPGTPPPLTGSLFTNAMIGASEPVTPVAEITDPGVPEGVATSLLSKQNPVATGENVISHDNRSSSISDLSSITLDSRPGSVVPQASLSSKSLKTKSRSRCSEAGFKTDASYQSDESERKSHSLSHRDGGHMTRRGSSPHNEVSNSKLKSGSQKRDITLELQSRRSGSSSNRDRSRLEIRVRPKSGHHEGLRELHNEDSSQLEANSRSKSYRENCQRVEASKQRRDIPDSQLQLQKSRRHSESGTLPRESGSRSIHSQRTALPKSKHDGDISKPSLDNSVPTMHRSNSQRTALPKSKRDGDISKPSLDNSVPTLHHSDSQCAPSHHGKSKQMSPSRSYPRNHLSSSRHCHTSSGALCSESSSRSRHDRSTSKVHLENSNPKSRHHLGSRHEPASKSRCASTSNLERELDVYRDRESHSDVMQQSSLSRFRCSESSSSQQRKHVLTKKHSDSSSRLHHAESRSLDPRHSRSRSRSRSFMDETQRHRNGHGHRKTSGPLRDQHSHVKLDYHHRSSRSHYEDVHSLDQRRKHQLDNSIPLSPPPKRSKKDHFRHSTPNYSKEFISGINSQSNLNCDDDSSSVVTLGSLDDPVILDGLEEEEENVQTCMNRSVDNDNNESLESGEIVSGEWSSLDLSDTGEIGELDDTKCEKPPISPVNLNSSNNCNGNRQKDLILTVAHDGKPQLLKVPPQTPPTPLSATKESQKLDYSCFNFSSSDISLSESSDALTSSSNLTQGNKTLLANDSQCQGNSSKSDRDGSRDGLMSRTLPPVSASASTSLDLPIPNTDPSVLPYNSPALQNQSPSVYLNTPSDPLHLNSESAGEECQAESDLQDLESLTHQMVQSSTWQNLEIPHDQKTSGRSSNGKQLTSRKSCSTSPRAQESDCASTVSSDRLHPRCDLDSHASNSSTSKLSQHNSPPPCTLTCLGTTQTETSPQQPPTDSTHCVQRSLSPKTEDCGKRTFSNNTHRITPIAGGSVPDNPTTTTSASGTVFPLTVSGHLGAEVTVLDSSHNYIDENSIQSLHAAEDCMFESPSSPIVKENCDPTSLSGQDNNQSLEEGEISDSSGSVEDTICQDSPLRNVKNSGSWNLEKRHSDMHFPSVSNSNTPSSNHKRDHHKRRRMSEHHFKKDKQVTPEERTKSHRSKSSRKEGSYMDKPRSVHGRKKSSGSRWRII